MDSGIVGGNMWSLIIVQILYLLFLRTTRLTQVKKKQAFISPVLLFTPLWAQF